MAPQTDYQDEGCTDSGFDKVADRGTTGLSDIIMYTHHVIIDSSKFAFCKSFCFSFHPFAAYQLTPSDHRFPFICFVRLHLIITFHLRSFICLLLSF